MTACSYRVPIAREQLRRALGGVSFTTARPFSEDGDRVLTDRIAENVRALYDEGALTFVPCGNTGVLRAVGVRAGLVIRTTVDALQDDATVVAGAGGSVGETRDLFRAYEAAGADAAMVMYPGHTYVRQRGLIDYFPTLAESIDLGIVL